jgi:hypothetical protein
MFLGFSWMWGRSNALESRYCVRSFSSQYPDHPRKITVILKNRVLKQSDLKVPKFEDNKEIQVNFDRVNKR